MSAVLKLPDGPFTTAEAAIRGVPGSTLRRMAARGEVERLSHGLYAVADDADYDVDLLAATVRTPDATICLTSALARHGLVDAIPARVDLALPRGQWHPVGQVALRWHAFDARTFEVGRETIAIAGSGRRIGLYSAERALADAFRLRSSIGYEVAVEALQGWLRRRGSSPAELVAVAALIPRAEGPIRQALSFLA